MKKVIKNYLTKLQDNENKGFSLVELIIVMAIMAILVGVVASQVIPYMEKSRQSKDQQQISSIATSLVSAIAQDANYDQSVSATGSSFSLADLSTNTTSTIAATFCDLMNCSTITDVVNTYSGSGADSKMKSKEAKSATGIEVTLDKSGKVTVKLTGTTSAKLEVESE